MLLLSGWRLPGYKNPYYSVKSLLIHLPAVLQQLGKPNTLSVLTAQFPDISRLPSCWPRFGGLTSSPIPWSAIGPTDANIPDRFRPKRITPCYYRLRGEIKQELQPAEPISHFGDGYFKGRSELGISTSKKADNSLRMASSS